MKSCLLVCPVNVITYSSFFRLIKSNIFHLGYNNINRFVLEDNSFSSVNCCWFTTLNSVVERPFLKLTKSYNPDDYPKFDNYDAINVDRVALIPNDYYGAMGVPVTFLFKYNPNQFEIIDCIKRYSSLYGNIYWGAYLTMLNNKPKYGRIIIKRKCDK